jgi:RNA-directed DNA polymerase
MASLEAFLRDRLRLTVNREKSAVARPWERKFLGYTIARHGRKLQVASKSVERLRAKLLPLLQRGARGRKLSAVFEEMAPITRGWVAYYRLAEVKGVFERIDKWVRRRVRAAIWRQWKKVPTRRRELVRRGVDPRQARWHSNNEHGPWWTAGTRAMHDAVPASELAGMGLVSFLDEYRRLNTA